MVLTKRWTDFGLKLHTKTAQAAAAVRVDGIRDQSINNALRTMTEGGDGSIYNTFGSLVSGAPTASQAALIEPDSTSRRSALRSSARSLPDW